MATSAEKLYYILSIFVLMSGLFVMGGTGEVGEVTELRQEIQTHLGIAIRQVWSDEPALEGVTLTWAGLTGFYQQAATELIALLDPKGTDEDILVVARAMWERTRGTGAVVGEKISEIGNIGEIGMMEEGPQGRVAGETIVSNDDWADNYMMEEPVLNIIP